VAAETAQHFDAVEEGQRRIVSERVRERAADESKKRDDRPGTSREGIYPPSWTDRWRMGGGGEESPPKVEIVSTFFKMILIN